MSAPAVTLPTTEVAATGRRKSLRLGFTGWLALAVVVTVALVALFAPLLAPADPDHGDLLCAPLGGANAASRSP